MRLKSTPTVLVPVICLNSDIEYKRLVDLDEAHLLRFVV